MENERWVTVAGYSSYEVSDCGRVRSFANKNGGRSSCPRVLAFSKRGKYLAVSLYNRPERHMKTLSVHRLVLTAFVGPPPNNYEAGHLNGDPHDNRLQNLRWVTKQENARHRYAHGNQPHGETCNFNAHPEERVQAVIDLHSTGRYGHSALSRIFRMPRSSVMQITSGRTWKHLRAAGVSEEEIAEAQS